MSDTVDESVTEDETLAVPVAALRPALEAILMVSDQPLDTVSLASVVGYRVEEVTEALAALAAEYDAQGRGFDLREVAGGWRFYTRDEFAGVVEAFVLDGQRARLTQAALETLAVVAYKQPVSRARVSAVRGVNVDGVMRTLVTRGLIEEAGGLVGDFAGGQGYIGSGNILAGSPKIYAEMLRLIQPQLPPELRR